MAQERVPRNNDEIVPGKAEGVYAYIKHEFNRRIQQDEVLTDIQDSSLYLGTKRILDVSLSTIALIILAPLMLIVAAIIFIDDPHGSPFFTQNRVGKNGKLFKMHNLRCMQVIHELHKIQIQIRRIISAKYTTFWLPNGFRHSIAGFAGVFAA